MSVTSRTSGRPALPDHLARPAAASVSAEARRRQREYGRVDG